MKTRDVIAGLVILQKYREDQGGYDLYADRDELFAMPTSRPLSADDLSTMVELGWLQDVDYRGESFTPEDYDDEASWMCYT